MSAVFSLNSCCFSGSCTTSLLQEFWFLCINTLCQLLLVLSLYMSLDILLLKINNSQPWPALKTILKQDFDFWYIPFKTFQFHIKVLESSCEVYLALLSATHQHYFWMTDRTLQSIENWNPIRENLFTLNKTFFGCISAWKTVVSFPLACHFQIQNTFFKKEKNMENARW